MKLFSRLALIGLLVVLAGCASDSDNKGPVYDQTVRSYSLEVPPDLSAPEFSSTYDIPNGGRVSARQAGDLASLGGQGVLPEVAGVTVGCSGQVYWLEVNRPAEELWESLVNFWALQKLKIKRAEKAYGVIETEWAENRAGISADWVTSILGFLYDAGTRDQYVMRVERNDSGKGSLVYIAHRGAKESAADADADVIKWEMRDSEVALEVEMLRRLAVYLGVAEDSAVKQFANVQNNAIKTTLYDQEAQPYLIVNDRFAPTWRRVGVALDRGGLIVKDKDIGKGIYYVTYTPNQEDIAAEPGLFGGIFSGSDKTRLTKGTRYQVHVTDQDIQVDVRVTNFENELLDKREALLVMQKIHKELTR